MARDIIKKRRFLSRHFSRPLNLVFSFKKYRTVAINSCRLTSFANLSRFMHICSSDITRIRVKGCTIQFGSTYSAGVQREKFRCGDSVFRWILRGFYSYSSLYRKLVTSDPCSTILPRRYAPYVLMGHVEVLSIQTMIVYCDISSALRAWLKSI